MESKFIIMLSDVSNIFMNWSVTHTIFQLAFCTRSSFSEYAQKFSKEDRFKGVEKSRDREGLFNEFILEVRRREKDVKQQKKETVSSCIAITIFICFRQVRGIKHQSELINQFGCTDESNTPKQPEYWSISYLCVMSRTLISDFK